MKQRYLIYGGAALFVLLIAVLRIGCRSDGGLPPGETLEARMQQIDAMRRRQHSGDVQRLVDLTGHDAQNVKLAAIYALSEFESTAASDALKQLIENGSDSGIRAAAAEGLGRKGVEIASLIDIASGHDDAVVRAGAARGLVSYSSTQRREALPLFLSALRDDDPEVRKCAIRGITAISKKRFLFEPDKDPHMQAERIQFIEQRMRDLQLVD